MINLAGRDDASERIRRELSRVGVDVYEPGDRVDHPDVKTRVGGRLGPFEFRRNWYYWVVSGPVPLAVAEELYADPVARTDVRVGGHCGCPSPHEYGTTWVDDQGRQLIVDADGKEATQARGLLDRGHLSQQDLDGWHFVSSKEERAKLATRAFVDQYHIDSELGLYLFVQALKRHGLTGTDAKGGADGKA